MRRKSTWSHLATAFVAVLVVGAASSPATAQTRHSHGGDEAAILAGTFLTGTLGLSTTILGPTTTVGGGLTMTVSILTNATDTKAAYIRNNAVALQHGLTIGGGPAVGDLAAIYRVEDRNVERFARMVRRHRAELLPLTDVDRLDGQRAERFFGVITAGMREDPRLRVELRELPHLL